MSTELNAGKLLENLEANYNQFEEHFNFLADQFLSDGEIFLKENMLPVIDMPLSALEYLKFRKG